LLCGVEVELIAAGGVDGTEGACWVALLGSEEQKCAAEKIYTAIANETPFRLSR